MLGKGAAEALMPEPDEEPILITGPAMYSNLGELLRGQQALYSDMGVLLQGQQEHLAQEHPPGLQYLSLGDVRSARRSFDQGRFQPPSAEHFYASPGTYQLFSGTHLAFVWTDLQLPRGDVQDFYGSFAGHQGLASASSAGLPELPQDLESDALAAVQGSQASSSTRPPGGPPPAGPLEEERGSAGHPISCGPPCKFFSLPRGCKDGNLCRFCHVCRWRRKPEAVRLSF
eukprot:gb/GFBE01025778.1/.p1 GENE.gb/GFBE01025778.1/~~gb/GFBE01025778.1/.p1  ORF type:complete len:229 (+),score=31.88 gb/GFBE01025778.1/:1-687(+)